MPLPCSWWTIKRATTTKSMTTATEVDRRARGERTRINPRGEEERAGQLRHFYRHVLVHCGEGRFFSRKSLSSAMTKQKEGGRQERRKMDQLVGFGAANSRAPIV